VKSKIYIIDYDKWILYTYFALMIIGIYMQLNISSIRTDMSFFYRQGMWVIISLFSLWFAFKKVNLLKIRPFISIFVVITAILLILVLVFGVNVKGATRSIRIWKFSIQPSLIARIVLIMYFAHILEKKKGLLNLTTPKFFLSHFNALLIVPAIIFFLILLEKHLSPIMISSLTLISLLFMVKVRITTIAIMVVSIIIAAFLIINLGAKYRSNRVEMYKKYSLFIPGTAEETGLDDYQIRESLISLAGGGIIGTGPTRGTGKHYFLPEAKTDYVFSIIGEEFGFLGALFVILLYCLLFYRTMMISFNNKNFYLKVLGMGLAMNIFFNAFVNIGVAMSALPSTGVTLPFISYGGTSFLVNSVSIGLLLNISAKRREVA
jgi:cell division protein FtsW